MKMDIEDQYKREESSQYFMTENDKAVDPSPVEQRTNTKRKGTLKSVVSTIAAGVVGSALTLTVLPYTDYFKNVSPSSTSSQQTIAATPAVKTVSASKTDAANGASSIADTVEKVSKAIVGIVNYQQQQQSNNFFGNAVPFDPFGNSGSSNSQQSQQSQSVEKGSGSGVIFQKTGNIAYIVTNNHVVEGASKLEVSLYNGTKTTAKVVGTDALTDIAVLQIDGKNVNYTAQFGDSSRLRPGDQVYAIGNPLGLDLSRTVTQGIVSATNRTISVPTSAGNWDTNVIQTDAAINPGNSGGALINPEGQVIGINSLKISESGVEGLGFAIPSNDFIPIVNQLIKNGKVERPRLGVGLADLNQLPDSYIQELLPNGGKGVLITSVENGSPAAKGGFQQKDIVVSMNGTAIDDSSALRKYLYTKVKIGETIKFGIYRNGKQMTLQVTLTK